jgi:hypothetical protein
MLDDKPAALELLTIGYRARCSDKCGNMARTIARRVDNQGRPMGQRELCLLHTVETEKQAKAQGLKLHDLRKKTLEPSK